MKFTHHYLEFELHDEWLVKAGMERYSATDDFYKPDITKANGQDVLIIPVNEIAPLVERAKCRGIFCNNEENTAEERVVRILKWVKDNRAIEPISVAKQKESEEFKYKVLAGCHRFHCSIAVGFNKVPAIIGFDADA